MKSLLITSAALIAALLVVLSTRLIFPAIEIIYYSILKSFEPQEPVIAGVLPMADAPVVITEKPAAPRKARRRKPSAKALARAAEALA